MTAAIDGLAITRVPGDGRGADAAQIVLRIGSVLLEYPDGELLDATAAARRRGWRARVRGR